MSACSTVFGVSIGWYGFPSAQVSNHFLSAVTSRSEVDAIIRVAVLGETIMKPLKLLAGMGFVVAIGAVIGIFVAVFFFLFNWAMSGDFLDSAVSIIPVVLFLGWFARRTFRQASEAWNSDDDLFIDAK